MEYRSILDPTHSATKRPTLRTARDIADGTPRPEPAADEEVAEALRSGRDIADGTARPETVAAREVVEAEIARVEGDGEIPSEAREAALSSLRRVLGRL